MTEQQPTTKLHTNYPPMPEPKHSRVVDGLPCITVYEHQNLMRAYVDADRTMRTQAAPAAHGDALDAAFEAVRHRLCGMQRYSFVLDDDDVVRRVEDRTGRWIEFDDAHELFDPVAVDAARSQAKEGA